jgi:hypothetical protein
MRSRTLPPILVNHYQPDAARCAAALARLASGAKNDAGRSTPQKVSGQLDLDTTMAAASARPLKEAASCDADER